MSSSLMHSIMTCQKKHMPEDFCPGRCSGGDLNPLSGFCFPLFSMVFPGEFPSGEKTAEGSGSEVLQSVASLHTLFLGVLSMFVAFPRPRKPQDNAFLSAHHLFAPT